MDKEKVKQWYDWGIWLKGMVADAVKKKKLTEDEYLYITGEKYVEQ